MNPLRVGPGLDQAQHEKDQEDRDQRESKQGSNDSREQLSGPLYPLWGRSVSPKGTDRDDYVIDEHEADYRDDNEFPRHG